jgi:hypothetical protein
VLPAAIDIDETMLGELHIKEIQKIPCADNTAGSIRYF